MTIVTLVVKRMFERRLADANYPIFSLAYSSPLTPCSCCVGTLQPSRACILPGNSYFDVFQEQTVL